MDCSKRTLFTTSILTETCNPVLSNLVFLEVLFPIFCREILKTIIEELNAFTYIKWIPFQADAFRGRCLSLLAALRGLRLTLIPQESPLFTTYILIEMQSCIFKSIVFKLNNNLISSEILPISPIRIRSARHYVWSNQRIGRENR